MDDPRIRASDIDRERTVATLQQHVGTGRLTLDEFSERAAAAYRARTLGDLATLTRDLPAATPGPATASHRALVPVLVVLAVLLAGALLAMASPATADAMNEMMAQVGRMCG
ncbi:DUF1707 domain-containing protein [Amycolatopsis sp. NPDC006131]|uniref:DUF1707 SHOCT-like domain-containing protein n=1 Tax=Amycolatopsis sp. NPDC006131 TaxID=3156731 RepID=UPI00339E923B